MFLVLSTFLVTFCQHLADFSSNFLATLPMISTVWPGPSVVGSFSKFLSSFLIIIQFCYFVEFFSIKMGVFSLQSYVEKNCPSVISKVDIRNLASKFRSSQGQKGNSNLLLWLCSVKFKVTINSGQI